MGAYPQRSEYLAGTVSHHAYYLSVARAACISYAASPALPRIREALAAGDTHLNTINLAWWDKRASMTRHTVDAALKLHGDSYSLAGSVCVHKAAALDAATSIVPEPVCPACDGRYQHDSRGDCIRDGSDL